MTGTSPKDPLSGPRLDPITESMVRLQGKPLFESVEGEHPSTVPQAAGPMAQPVRLGQYLIEKELGRGGMGVVYRAYDTQRHQTVALKVLLAVGPQDRRHLVRFVEEASTMDRLEHRNIVQVYDIGLQGEVPYLALEYLELGALHRKSDGKPVEPRYAAYLVAGMADGIQHAHEHGVLHRDLKPANILLRARSVKAGSVPEEFLEEPVISDFGLAKRLDSLEQVTQTGQAVGTPNYMSPEQAAGHKELLGPAADIYGLGAILYELLTGHPPFLGMNPVETMQLVVHHAPVPPRQFLPRIPIELERICLRCLEKLPGARYATAAELAEELRRFLRGELPTIEPKSTRETPWQWFRRHALVTGLAFLGMFLFLTGLMLLMVFIWQMHSRMLQLTEEKEEALRRLQQGQPLLLRQEAPEKPPEAPNK